VANKPEGSFQQTMLAEELARKAMGGRKKSPGHDANLLQKRAQEIGIGAAGWKSDGGQEIFRVVQVFASACPQKRQSNPWIVKTLAGTVRCADRSVPSGLY